MWFEDAAGELAIKHGSICEHKCDRNIAVLLLLLLSRMPEEALKWSTVK